MEWFQITDIDRFIEASRVLVYHNFGSVKEDVDLMQTMIEDLVEEEQIEIEKVLNQEETMCIFKEFSQRRKLKNKKTEYRISEKNYFLFIEALNSRMVSNILNNMVNQGIIESAFDSESNDFVFWIKENNDKSHEDDTPETD